MYLLDALDKFESKTDSVKLIESEYELLSRVHLTGELDFACVLFHFWEEPSFDAPRSVRAAYLRVAEPEFELKDIPKEEQYYVPGGIADEIAILMSLFTRAHFVVSRRLSSGNLHFLQKFAHEGDVSFGDMDGRAINLGAVQPLFQLLKGLRLREAPNSDGSRRKRIEPFMLAARFYHVALPLIREEETLAYISLVSAIEALLHDYGLEEMGLGDWNEKAADLIKAAVIDPNTYKQIESEILRKAPLIKRRFVEFVASHLMDNFWNDSTRPKDPQWSRFRDVAELREYLGRIYDARSNALHRGEPFPPSVPGAPEERPMGLGVRVGKKEWKEKELIPPVRAFERIVHHVLMEYLRREATASKK